jgi:ribosome-binding protein aMBF1 (putative translation factor)
MESKKKKTSSAVEIMHKRYIKGNKRRLKNIEQEGKRIEIAQQIYTLRKQKGLSQKEFAEKVNMKQSVISRLENADYRGYKVDTLERIAQAMNQELHFHFVPSNMPCAITQR